MFQPFFLTPIFLDWLICIASINQALGQKTFSKLFLHQHNSASSISSQYWSGSGRSLGIARCRTCSSEFSVNQEKNSNYTEKMNGKKERRSKNERIIEDDEWKMRSNNEDNKKVEKRREEKRVGEYFPEVWSVSNFSLNRSNGPDQISRLNSL